MSSQSWYLYPIDNPGGSYGQIQDPLGNYLKPDVNVAVPSGTPITALGSGVVTSVKDHGKNSGGLSVVVKLTNPLNNLATHESYNFLGSSSVQPGQTITTGQQIGVAGSPYGINTAFALTADDVWGNGTFNQNANGNPLLDPHLVLDAWRGSLGGQQGTLAAGQVPGSTTSNAPIVGPLIDWFNQQKQQFQGLLDWISNPIRVLKMFEGIFLIAIALILLLIPSKQDITTYVRTFGPMIAGAVG